MSRQPGPRANRIEGLRVEGLLGRLSATLLALALVSAVLAPFPTGAVEVPHIQVFPREAMIQGSSFLGNMDISVVIDRVQGGQEDPFVFATDDNGNFRLRLSDFGLAGLVPGDQVRVTDGAVTKTLIVEALEVTGSDVQADTVWGTAPPGTPVEVSVEIDGLLSVRRVVGDAMGDWLADFSVSGQLPDETAVDFPYGQSVGGEALGQLDEDGDRTGWQWGTRAPYVWVSDNNINADGWLDGTVDIQVDDAATPGIDYHQTFPISGGGFNVGLPEGLIAPGVGVIVTDGTITASFEVPDLTITNVDVATDLATGTSLPGVMLEVSAFAFDDSYWAGISVTAGADGTWEADFAGVADITYGWGAAIDMNVAPNASYVAEWHLPMPILMVDQAGGAVGGAFWPVGSVVDVEIDDPEVQGEIADFAFTVSSIHEPGMQGAYWQRDLGEEFPLEPGHIVMATDVAGTITKVLVVGRIEIEAIQTSFDTVSGWAAPNQPVEVSLQTGDGGRRLAVADSDGRWMVDFSQSSGSDDQEENKVVDLTIGTAVEARTADDEDGDYTHDVASVQIVPGGGLPPVVHTVGLVNPDHGLWRLLDSNGVEHSFYYGSPGDIPMVGDWDCDGDETPGLYRQSDGYVYLRNSNDTGPGEVRFTLGVEGDIPLAGDFNGDGCDTVAVYRPGEGHVYMTNELGENEGFFVAQYDYYFGDPGDKPFVGDFDGDGIETVGLHRESTGFVYFRQTHTTGAADSEFFFGIPNDRILAGDWNEDYRDTVAIFRPADATLYFRNSNTLGVADDTLVWGQSSWLPLAGEFGF